jgi:uncharacterized tellurite resistance protein B-like protein
MPTQSSQTAVLDDLIQEMGAGDIDISEAIKLSPPLVQAACLLYTMASDGKIQEQEISQLQERQKLNGKLTPSEQERLSQLWQQQEKIVEIWIIIDVVNGSV